MIKLTPLFSGSKGNSTLVQTPNCNILLDAGGGYRALTARLAMSGIRPVDISAIVVTHEHSDHISALKSWQRHCRTAVFAPKACCDYISQYCGISQVTPSDDGLDIADVHISCYVCSHDARACLGYKFSDKDGSVASVTDTGIANNKLVQFLQPCTTIMLESNHDPDMLRYGQYPAQLKRRIASELGHLSNVQASEVLRRLIGSSVKNVVLSHLSENNNTKQLALDTVTQMYATNGVVLGRDVFLYVADQHNNGVTL